MANVSSLTVNFIAQTARFENGVKKAKAELGSFGKVAEKAFKGAAAGVAVMTGALTLLVKQSLQVADEQRKIARALETSQGTVAALGLAAELSGVQQEKMFAALKRGQKSITDARNGMVQQKRAIDALGLSIDDLLKLPIEQQFSTLLSSLSKVENATERAGIGFYIFGEQGANLVDQLALGEDGFDGFIKKVNEFGIALTEKQTKAIEDANDSVSLMNKAFAGLGNQLAARVAPVMQDVAEAITSITVRVTQAIPQFLAWASSILGVRRELESLTLADLNAEILQADSDLNDAIGSLKAQQKLIADRGGAIAGSSEDQLLKSLQTQVEELSRRYNDLIAARRKLKAEGEILVPETGEATTRTKATTRDTPDKAIFAELEKNLKLFDDFEAKATKAFDATRTPAEALRIAMEDIREQVLLNPFFNDELAQRSAQEAVDKYLAEMERLKAEQEKTQAQVSEFALQAARNMQDIFADFFTSWDDGLDGMLKSFADMLRKMVAQLLASKLLDYIGGLFGVVGLGSGKPTASPRAHGGVAQGGRPLTVGEYGREIFTPGATGAVRPLGAVTINSTLNVNGSGSMSPGELIPILEENNRKLKAELLDEFDRGAFA